MEGAGGWATHETAIDAKQLYNAIQQMFSPSADPSGDELRLSMEEYIKYKKRYVKHLQFDPDLQNLSKFSFYRHLCKTVFYFQLP